MHDVILCVVIVLLIIWLFVPNILCVNNQQQPHSLIGYATDTPAVSKPRGSTGEDYNNYLQEAALDPSIKEQHSQWLDNLQINLQPRMYSIRDDYTTDNLRVGLLRPDFSNSINESQNIQIPSGRSSDNDESRGNNGRFGGYSIKGDL